MRLGVLRGSLQSPRPPRCRRRQASRAREGHCTSALCGVYQGCDSDMTRSHTPSCDVSIETRHIHALAHFQPYTRVALHCSRLGPALALGSQSRSTQACAIPAHPAGRLHITPGMLTRACTRISAHHKRAGIDAYAAECHGHPHSAFGGSKPHATWPCTRPSKLRRQHHAGGMHMCL